MTRFFIAAFALLAAGSLPAMAAPDAVTLQNEMVPRVPKIAAAPMAGNGSALLAAATRVGNYANSTTSTFVPVPLDDAGSTTLAFTTTVPNQKIIFYYNAECGALGPPGEWLSVKIVIDNTTETNPRSGAGFALCTATSTSAYSWVGAMRMGGLRVPTPGAHFLQVLGYGASTTQWWLGDSSLFLLNVN